MTFQRLHREAQSVLRLLLFVAIQAAATAETGWLRLLHFPPGGNESDVLPGAFFLDPRGHVDPDAEMRTALRRFQADSPEADAATACRFPARIRWLRGARPGERLIHPDCPDLAAFQAQNRAARLHLAFASHLPTHPASAFGHIFLVLQPVDASGDTLPLLASPAVNYGARLDSATVLNYLAKGLMGGFGAGYSIMPFHRLSRKYGLLEHRDLWLYPLDLDSLERTILVEHLWELRSAGFRYYFLTRNCSWHIAALLEAVRPEWNLRRQFHLFAYPIDPFRDPVLEPAGPLPRIPSTYTAAESALASLPADLRTEAVRAVEQMIPAESMPSGRRDSIRPAVLRLWDYRYAWSTQADSARLAFKAGWMRQASTTIPSPPPDRGGEPQAAHRPARLRGGVGWTGSGSASDAVSIPVEFRLAFHDAVDPGEGLIAGGEFVVGKVRAALVPERPEIAIQRVDLFRLRVAPPFQEWRRRLSWMAAVGLEPMSGGGEAATSRWSRRLAAFGMLAPGITFQAGEAGLLTPEARIVGRWDWRSATRLETGPALRMRGEHGRWTWSGDAAFLGTPIGEEFLDWGGALELGWHPGARIGWIASLAGSRRGGPAAALEASLFW